MIRSIINDTKQGIFSIRFVISCIILILLMTSTTGVTIGEQGYGYPTCSILQMFFKTDSSLWERDLFYSSYMVWSRGIHATNIGAFLPAIVSFPMLPLFCDEIKSQNYRFHCIRTNRKEYILSKCISSMIVGSCVAMAALVIFGIICLSILPPMSAYKNDITVIQAGFDLNTPYAEIIQKSIFIMAFAVSDAIVCLLVAALTVDKFSSLCLPVVIFFLCNLLGSKLYVRSGMVDTRYFIISPDYHYKPYDWFPQLFPNVSLWFVLLMPVAVIVICTPVVYFLTKRRIRQ